MKQFYSYLWLREDGTPYYVGKGFGDRAFVSRGHKTHCPKEHSRILICPAETEAEAFASELVMIDLFGRKDLGTGYLRNFTDGGEGRAGYQIPIESRRRMGISQKGNINSCAYKKSERGRQDARAVVQAHGLTFLGRVHSAETRAKQSVAAKARWGRVHAS